MGNKKQDLGLVADTYQTRAEVSSGETISNGLKQAQDNAIGLLKQSYEALTELATVRAGNKLSNSRVSGVAKEVRELIKVMSLYKCG